MAKPNLFRHPKLRHLTRLLRGLDVGPFPRMVAVGVLESLWQESYAVPSAFLGSCDDVEEAVHWDREPGALAKALLEARFLDRVEDGYVIHDWLEHLPDFARKRVNRAKKKKPRADTGEPSPPTPLPGGEGSKREPLAGRLPDPCSASPLPLGEGLGGAQRLLRQSTAATTISA